MQEFARVGSEVAAVGDRVAVAAGLDPEREGPKLGAMDLVDEQLDHGVRIVIERCDCEVEVRREPSRGAGVDLAQRGPSLEATIVRTPRSDRRRSRRSCAMSMSAAPRP